MYIYIIYLYINLIYIYYIYIIYIYIIYILYMFGYSPEKKNVPKFVNVFKKMKK